MRYTNHERAMITIFAIRFSLLLRLTMMVKGSGNMNIQPNTHQTVCRFFGSADGCGTGSTESG